jgi:multidrug efflux pump subunit AcrA (membrane-fusion protein)
MLRVLKITFIILLVAVAAACSPGGDNQQSGQAQAQAAATVTPIPTAPSVAKPTYLVQRGDVQNILEFSGRWQPRDQLILAFQIAGTVRRVTVKQGDAVSAGQLLADFQITDLENQLASAQIQLQSAQNSLQSGSDSSVSSVADAQIALANAKLSLENTKAGSPWTQVASAKVSLDNAKLSLEKAQRDYDDAISRPNQAASVTENAYQTLQNAKNSLRSAQVNYDSAAQTFNKYQYTVAQAENQVLQSQLNLIKASTGSTNANGEEAVRSAQLNIDQIKAKIAQSSLYSPIDGQVLSVTIKPGDQVQAFTTVITVGKPEPKEAVASLAYTDAQRMSVGMVGICQIVNRPETAVQCVVRRIPLSSKDADQTTRVAASLEKVASDQLIQVQMPLQVSQNVLWLPPTAVRTFQNRTFVVLQTPDGPRSVDVQVGLQTTDRVEIKSGLKEGDIAIGP